MRVEQVAYYTLPPVRWSHLHVDKCIYQLSRHVGVGMFESIS